MSLIGIDIGNNSCKIAMRDGGGMKLVSNRTPENMVDEGRVTSPETMAKYLSAVRKQDKVREKKCVLVLSGAQAFFRHVTLPPMNVGELMLNLPYEFRDFISGDPDEYIYDYAVDQIIADTHGTPMSMELYAAAAPREAMESAALMLKKAGFKLQAVTPAPLAYSRLLRAYAKRNPQAATHDVVLVDIGQEEVTVSLFRDGKYDSAKTIDFGCAEIDRSIADERGIDPYTASNYKLTNFDGVLESDGVLAVCDRLAIEVNKTINFYNFNNPEREIEALYFLGGGAHIPQVTEAIAEVVSIPCQSIEAILPPEAQGRPNAAGCALAIGALLEGEAM